MTRSGGPERVVTDDPNPDFVPRHVGFTAPPIDADPLLWDGDGA